jgi:hypothetical protein
MSEAVIFNLRRPSDALEAMCDGLEAISTRDGFVIDMSQFGRGYADGYHVCAATCTSLQASGCLRPGWGVLDSPTGRANYFQLPYDTYRRFEEAMDLTRYGDLSALAEFFGLVGGELNRWRYQWEMRTEGWQATLSRVRVAIQEMRELNL